MDEIHWREHNISDNPLKIYQLRRSEERRKGRHYVMYRKIQNSGIETAIHIHVGLV